MRRAVCPGSFDPVTLGHLDVIGRAAQLFDEVLVVVGANSRKSGLFTPDERVELLREECAPWPEVSVGLLGGLLVDFCTEHRVSAVVKGLRSATDFDYELQMAQMNAALTGVETVFLPTSPRWSYVSSTLVREIAAGGGDVSACLSPAVAARTVERTARPRPR